MDIKSEFWCQKGHFNKDQADYFMQLVKEYNPKYVLETGFCTGRSAYSVLNCAKGLKKFVTIDINFDYIKPEGKIMRDKLSRHFKVFKYYVGSSKDILNEKFISNEFPNGIDWFTVDGDHNYMGCLYDLEIASKHINHNGIMIIDDYKSGPPNGCVITDVNRACDYFYQKHPEFSKMEWNCLGKGFCILRKL